MVAMETFIVLAPRASRGRTMIRRERSDMMMQMMRLAGDGEVEGNAVLTEEGVHHDAAGHGNRPLGEEEHLRRAEGDDETQGHQP